MSDNIKLAFDYVDENEGKVFTYHKDGSRWMFVGILLAKDDIYYEMKKLTSDERMYLSFVGAPESFGFDIENENIQEYYK